MATKLTNETFIERANLKHNNLYDYSLVEYMGAHSKVKIICKHHGEFQQVPNDHLKGSGCKACYYEATAKANIATAKSEFANKASLIHNDKYSYELVDYKNSYTKVSILCPSHGSFFQSPSSHLSGAGCPICGIEANNKARVATAKSEFSTKANLIHDNKYDYSLVDYKNAHTKVAILCPIHGSFLQTPQNHLSKRGCPICALTETGWTRTKFKDKCIKNNNSQGILYVIGCWSDDKSEVFVKIGITSRSIKQRYDSKISMPYNYKVLHEISGSPEFIYDLETLLHKKSKNYKYIPITSFAGSSTECFEADLTYLSKLNDYLDFKKETGVS